MENYCFRMLSLLVFSCLYHLSVHTSGRFGPAWWCKDEDGEGGEVQETLQHLWWDESPPRELRQGDQEPWGGAQPVQVLHEAWLVKLWPFCRKSWSKRRWRQRRQNQGDEGCLMGERRSELLQFLSHCTIRHDLEGVDWKSMYNSIVCANAVCKNVVFR